MQRLPDNFVAVDLQCRLRMYLIKIGMLILAYLINFIALILKFCMMNIRSAIYQKLNLEDDINELICSKVF